MRQKGRQKSQGVYGRELWEVKDRLEKQKKKEEEEKNAKSKS